MLLKNKTSSNGTQSLSRPLDHSQHATATMDQMARIAPRRSAPVPTDQRTAHLEPHALRKSQIRSHTTTPTHKPEDHTKPLVMSPLDPRSQCPLTHGQLP